MTELIAMSILAAAAGAGFLYWLRQRPLRRESWPPTQPLRSAQLGPAPPSESSEAARLRRHMAQRAQLHQQARENTRKERPEPANQGFAETTIQEDPLP